MYLSIPFEFITLSSLVTAVTALTVPQHQETLSQSAAKHDSVHGAKTVLSSFHQKRYGRDNNAATINNDILPPGPLKPIWEKENKWDKISVPRTHDDTSASIIITQNKNEQKETSKCDIGIISCDKGQICREGMCIATKSSSNFRKLSHLYVSNCVNIEADYPGRVCDCSDFDTSTSPYSGSIICTEMNGAGTVTISYVFGTNTISAIRGSETVEVEYKFTSSRATRSIVVDGCSCTFDIGGCTYNTSRFSTVTCPGLSTINTCDKGIDKLLNIDPICVQVPTASSASPIQVSPPVPTPTMSTPTIPTAPTIQQPTLLQPITGTISVPSPEPSQACILGFICTCFSSTNLVQVYGKGLIRMDELQIGDLVKVFNHNKDNLHHADNDKSMFSHVISFAHKDETSEGIFLQIYTTTIRNSNSKSKDDTATDAVPIVPLEISHDHIVKKSDGSFARANDVQVGDVLQDGMVIVNIQTIKSLGLYAPITETGTIIVSGITTSSYVAILKTIPAWIQHYWAHALYAPIRLFRLQSLRDMNWTNSDEAYTDDGLSDNYVLNIVRLIYRVEQYPVFVQITLTFFLSPMIVFMLVTEQLMLLWFAQKVLVTFIVVSTVSVLWNLLLLSIYSKKKKVKITKR